MSEIPLPSCVYYFVNEHLLCTSHLYPLFPLLQGWAGIKTFQSPGMRLLSDFPVLFKADLISKDFSRKPSKFKHFSSLCELCGLYYQLLVSLI